MKTEYAFERELEESRQRSRDGFIRRIRNLAVSVLLMGGTVGLSHADENFDAGDLRRSGTITLEVTIRPELEEEFETCVALLHSFFYDEARRRFAELGEHDPKCAMAHWGVAMTWFHPLWAPPSLEERAMGLAAIQKAREIGGKTELERGLIDAVMAYYSATETPVFEKNVIAGCSCCGPQAHSLRAKSFHREMESLHQRFPKHVEVASFYALAKLGTADPSDKTYAKQRFAGSLLEELFKTNLDHPGIAHYIIHAYDYPELASHGLKAARRYDEIAPWVPHALHMPTHIYTRLGMWQDSIDGNIASSEASRNYAGRFYDGGATMNDLHAMDYLMFAYQQTGRDSEAEEVMDYLAGIETIVPGNEFASAYAIAAMPARHTLERRAWKEAASLKLSHAEFVGQFPFAVAHVEFAHAVGAARSGQLELAEKAIERLEQLRDSVTDPKFQWWIGQIEIQRLAAQGWLDHVQGRHEMAEAHFREAAEIEDKAGTHPVTPGQILPAREQLGEVLLETGDAKAALEEFEKSLIFFPRRFHSHEGAMLAAAQMGNTEKAQEHATELIKMAGNSADRIGIITEARRVIAAGMNP